MYRTIFLLSFFFGIALTTVGASGLSTCVRNYEKVGCYDEYHANIKDLVVYDRYGIKWTDIVGYMHHLACTCELKVREANKKRPLLDQYVGFALHFWGECYGKEQAQVDSLASKSKSQRCTGDQTYTKCYERNPECTGHAFSEFVYKLRPLQGDIRTVIGCNINGFNVSCDKGTVAIKDLSYGKRTSDLCGDPLTEGWEDKCKNVASQSKHFFESFCLNKATCLLPDWAKDPDDPCPSVKKYLTVAYNCKI